MFSKFNRNSGRKSLKNPYLRQYGSHLSRLSSSHKKALIVISVIPTGIAKSFADEVNLVQGKGTHIFDQGSAKSQLDPWAKAILSPQSGSCFGGFAGTFSHRLQIPNTLTVLRVQDDS